MSEPAAKEEWGARRDPEGEPDRASHERKARNARPSARSVITAVLTPSLLVFVAIPMAVLLAKSLVDGPGVYLDAIRSPSNRAALANTLIAGLGTAMVALAVGAPLGAALARLNLAGKRILGTLLVLPLAAPPYVLAMAWIALASPHAGWINRVASGWGLPSPLVDIYGMPGIIWVLGLSLYPFVLLPTRAALESADPSLEEAARIGGAGPLRSFVTGSLPVAAPAIAAGTLTAFLGAISAFGVPYLLGVATERPVLVATTRIYQAMSLGAEADVRSSIAICVLLLLLAFAATFAAERAARARSLSTKGRRPRSLDAPVLTRVASGATWLFTLIAVALPMVATLLAALTKRFSDPPGPGNLTLGQFTTVLSKADTRSALLHSALLATVAATLIVTAGLSIAFLRRRGRGSPHVATALSRMAELPYAVPGSVLALALLLTFSQEIRFIFLERVTIAVSFLGTLWLLLVAYVVKYLAFGVRSADNAIVAVDPTLEEAARISGAGPGRAFFDVSLPLARPALLAAWILAFLPAATELTMSVLLAGPRSQVLGTLLFELSSYADPPSAAVLGCIALALVVAADVLLRRLTERPETT